MRHGKYAIRTFAIGVLLATMIAVTSGCGSGAWIVSDNVQHQTEIPPDPAPVPNPEFDVSACANAIANQAELANTSPAFAASEVLDGILTLGVATPGDESGSGTGIPVEFATKIRTACPVIGVKPPCDLTAEQVQTIRNVR